MCAGGVARMPECLNPGPGYVRYAGGSAIAGALPRRNLVITRGTQLGNVCTLRWWYVCTTDYMLLLPPVSAAAPAPAPAVVVVAHDGGTYLRRFPFAFVHHGERLSQSYIHT